MKSKTIAILLVTLLAVSSCMTVDLSVDTAEPISMTGETEKNYRVVRHFEKPHKAWFTLFDLVTTKNPDINATIESEIRKADADAIINLEVTGQTTVLDGLIPIAMTVAGTYLGYVLAPDLLLGPTYGTILGSIAGALLSARTYTVSGDVIRYKK